MSVSGWKYYNHAMIPTTAPHEECELPKDIRSLWKNSGRGTPLFARWTTDFDCGFETNWWYVIKDTPFVISHLKAKRRYETNKGIRNFNVLLINPAEYTEELYRVQVAAFSAYPKKYRPIVDKQKFIDGLTNWAKYQVFGAFFKETNELAGYALVSEKTDSFLNFTVLKTDPAFEKYAVNAALVHGILLHNNDFLEGHGILCDGARSINHESNFQDYLEKYFGFRKAYCKLHILYNPKISWAIKLFYPIRKLLLKLDGIGFVHQINAVLKMEEIIRSQT